MKYYDATDYVTILKNHTDVYDKTPITKAFQNAIGISADGVLGRITRLHAIDQSRRGGKIWYVGCVYVFDDPGDHSAVTKLFSVSLPEVKGCFFHFCVCGKCDHKHELEKVSLYHVVEKSNDDLSALLVMIE